LGKVNAFMSNPCETLDAWRVVGLAASITLVAIATVGLTICECCFRRKKPEDEAETQKMMGMGLPVPKRVKK
jgi:hypothetical protein